jgi:hypothetical protein
MHLQAKNILKNNHYHTSKHPLNLVLFHHHFCVTLGPPLLFYGTQLLMSNLIDCEKWKLFEWIFLVLL